MTSKFMCRVIAFLSGSSFALVVLAGPAAITAASNSVTVTGTATTTLTFPITRTGDTSYGAYFNYQTVDGSAVAGVDYTAASGTVMVPAGATDVSVPVAVLGSSTNSSDKTFSLNLTAAGVATAPKFITQSFVTGSMPVFVTVADVNGDGKPDLIVAESGTTVSVLLNTTAPGATTPTFAARQSFAVGHGPASVAIADVNGDGKPELLGANRSDNTISVLLNTTAPGATTVTFAAQQTFATGSGPTSVVAADVNGDGMPDLVVANFSANTVSVLLNTTAPGAATPSFAAQQAFAAGRGPASVTLADVNGDGKPDLVVANSNDNTVSVLLNATAPGAATPAFAGQQAFATEGAPDSVVAVDVNGDGVPDLIVANSAANTVSVLLNTTAPGATALTFAAQQTFATGRSPSSVAVADLDGDGRPDLILANSASTSISVLLNTTVPGSAMPSFLTRQFFLTGMQPTSVVAADFNGDGRLDLATANNQAAGTVSVLLNETAAFGAGTTTFAPQQTFALGNGPHSMIAADVNGDGKPDLIAGYTSGTTISVLLNTTAPGATTPTFAAQQTFTTGSGPRSIAVADVNGDGKPDLIVANFYSNTVSVLINTTAAGATTPSFAAQQTFATGAEPASVKVVDVNGDGKPDIIVADFGATAVSVLLNTTAPGSTTASFATQQPFATGVNPGSVAVADMNGDGKPDLVVANGNDNTVSVLLNTTAPGAATPTFAAQQVFATGRTPIVTTADVNGDGLPDVIVANTDDNTVSVFLNTTPPGATTLGFATQQTFGNFGLPDSVAVADINGDGKPDLIVANGFSLSASVLLNTTAPGAAAPTFVPQPTFSAGNTPTGVTVMDVNGDGKPDLIVANGIDATASVLLNTQYAVSVTPTSVTGTIHYGIASGSGGGGSGGSSGGGAEDLVSLFLLGLFLLNKRWRRT